MSKSEGTAGVERVIRVAARIRDIASAEWDRVALPDVATANPFVSHAFLAALEDAGTVSERTGWLPQHLSITGPDGRLAAAAPAYLKTHSQGEYVFDHGWADAFERAGGQYYPKLQIAVPFSPVPGPRLLVSADVDRAEYQALLAAGAVELATRLGLSSIHATFLDEATWARLSDVGYLQRTDQQFHWSNAGYATFDDFLSALASRKRKTIRREREQAQGVPGLTIEQLTGAAITEAHWDAFFTFYQNTGNRKWGRPYLNRRFFSLLGEAMADKCLLILASRDGRAIAGALNLIGGDCLYGRYWGATEQHPCLHFEICYYQAIDYAIRHKLPRVEAGAQGEHKLARGYMPTPTYSAHWIGNASFRKAVARYLTEERRAIAEQREMLAEYGPFKKVVEEQD
jgi:uncharacterized protein